MKIMKIDMLSFDNKIVKDQPSDSKESTQATTKSHNGMDALAFQGLRNLMEDPKLAQELRVMNDGAEQTKDESAKSYVAPFSSNVPFKSLSKTKALTMSAIFAAAAALVSCEKNEYTTPPPINKSEVYVSVSDKQDNQVIIDILNKFWEKMDELIAVNKGIYENGKTTNEKLDSLDKKILDLGVEATNIKKVAIEVRNSLASGIDVDTSVLEAWLQKLDLDENASHAEIVAKLDAFIANQEKLEAAINKYGTENGTKLDYIASLILNKTPDNAAVVEAIENLEQSNETNINAAVEKLAAKLDILVSKVDGVMGKMDDLSGTLKYYGDKVVNHFSVDDEILAAIKANGAKIDINNMTVEQLKAEVEKLKPELEKLNVSAENANNYLNLILNKRLPEIKAQIDSLQIIAGKALTKEELEDLWKKHDADNYKNYTAFLDTLHAEDIGKANEIIALMKKGNAINQNIYNTVLDFANKNNLSQEELKALLKAVYEYLPELKCNCQCQGDCDNNGNHEGIIGDLLD